MILVRNIRLPLSSGEKQAVHTALKILRLNSREVEEAGISKISVDGRGGDPRLVYTVAVTLKDKKAEAALAGAGPGVAVMEEKQLVLPRGTETLQHRPVVCGLGPAGLFAALLLARQGLRPLVLERGPCLDKRVKAVERFFAGRELEPNANIQFGEGGAGTFSDGKLTTRIGDDLCGFVSKTLLEHGAPAEIMIRQKPHVGTDKLRDVITSIRKEIETLGGEVWFDTRLTGLQYKNGTLTGVKTTRGEIPCQALVLAVGHSARDTFEMLMEEGLEFTCKPFSVGVRAEHLQTAIEEGLYHQAAGHPALPRGEYQLSQHFGDRCVYTFCMCPGGQVVAAASEQGGVVTNGMSYHARSGPNANAAVVVSVDGRDFENDPRKAIEFQRMLEKKAYLAGGSNYSAPAETMDSFLKNEGKLNLARVQPTYSRGVQACKVGELFPGDLGDLLRRGFEAFDRKLPGYAAPDVVLTGVETRTSSPVRLCRGEDFQSVQLKGLYPCGEGAGYAGGIVSAAVDGLRVARAILAKYN